MNFDSPLFKKWAGLTKLEMLSNKRKVFDIINRARGEMGSTRLLCANNSEARVFKFAQPFYSIFNQRRQQIVFGERPEDLRDVQSIDQRIWEKHQTYLSRIENFPLKKAAYYRNLQESTGVKSVRGLSEITGEDWSYIAKVLKILELPEFIRSYLNKNQHQTILKHFHLRRLLELLRLPPGVQPQRFQEMINGVEQEECLASE